jgi:general secretion pathway protein K
MALVITLMVMAIITAMVVEFAYGVYVNTGFLNNWQASQELRLSARSGTSLAAYFIEQETETKKYTYPGTVYLPPVDPFMDGSSTVSIQIEDEDSKFNLNTLVYQNGDLNEESYESFIRMLEYLDIDTEAADRIVDWIDPDDIPLLSDSERGAKSSEMQSADELMLIPGVSGEVYDKLIDYVSAYGNELVNINGAQVPVLITLSEEMDEEMAKRITSYRGATPFKATSDISKVAGFETLGISLQGKISVKGTAFGILSKAESAEGISSIIKCVIDGSGNVKYWREY